MKICSLLLVVSEQQRQLLSTNLGETTSSFLWVFYIGVVSALTLVCKQCPLLSIRRTVELAATKANSVLFVSLTPPS